MFDQNPPPTLERKAPTSENHHTAIHETMNTASAARKIIRKTIFYRLEAASAIAQITPIIARIIAPTSAKRPKPQNSGFADSENDSFQVLRKRVSARFTPSGATPERLNSPEVRPICPATPTTLQDHSQVSHFVELERSPTTLDETSSMQLIQFAKPGGVFGQE